MHDPYRNILSQRSDRIMDTGYSKAGILAKRILDAFMTSDHGFRQFPCKDEGYRLHPAHNAYNSYMLHCHRLLSLYNDIHRLVHTVYSVLRLFSLFLHLFSWFPPFCTMCFFIVYIEDSVFALKGIDG